MSFIGKQPTAGFASIVKDDLTADGSTTAFTLSKQVANANDIAVFVGNVRQEPTDAYTVSGTTLTMSAVMHLQSTLDMFFILVERLRVLLFLSTILSLQRFSQVQLQMQRLVLVLVQQNSQLVHYHLHKC